MTLKECIKLIKMDLARIDTPSMGSLLKHYLLPRGEVFKFNVWLRLTQWSKSYKITKYTVGILVYAIMRHYEYKYGIHVNANINIGGGLLIVHGDGVHLNVKNIGENVTVYQGVTCGSKDINHGKDIPTIEDNVVIYTNSVVVGNIILRNDSIIGANSYVSYDVNPGSVVAGIPAVSIRRKRD